MSVFLSVWSNWGWVIFSVFVFILFCLGNSENIDLTFGDVGLIGAGLIWGQIRSALNWPNNKFGVYIVVSGIILIFVFFIAIGNHKN